MKIIFVISQIELSDPCLKLTKGEAKGNHVPFMNKELKKIIMEKSKIEINV